MKSFEILDKGNARFVLTVTPDRVTIKLQAGTTEEDRDRVITFLTWVSTQPEMNEYMISFRGRVNIPPTNIPLLIQMVNDSGAIKFTFRENEMYS